LTEHARGQGGRDGVVVARHDVRVGLQRHLDVGVAATFTLTPALINALA
jgi:hypothetical protein